eukprot:TRINITY_DN6893_c0_g1_i2.p1 TRINITY_DN6893_c0_g1~~TRINITY_DN6893_c0_g1_i2.p1  ORF type:complete len:202 (-),score=12.28 TRINITY_DN6893_c0_g1_i2:44-649(-)
MCIRDSHIYCGACGKKVNKCPISREPITQRNDIPLPLKNFLGEQIMKCEYFEKGCLWKGKYEDYCKHSEKDCQFSIISIKCEICQKIIKSINFDQHLIDERLQHYEIAKQKMQQKPQQSFDEETLYKEVKISIHPHKLQFAGSRTNGWFCDSLTDAPDKICLSGHNGSSYNHQGAASLVFLCPNLCSHSYCFKCVQKYKTD